MSASRSRPAARRGDSQPERDELRGEDGSRSRPVARRGDSLPERNELLEENANRSRPAARRGDSQPEPVALQEAEVRSCPATTRGSSLEEWRGLREAMPRLAVGNDISTAECYAPEVKLPKELAVVPTKSSLQTLGISSLHAVGPSFAGSEMPVGMVPSQEEVEEKMYRSVAGPEILAVPSVQNVGISSQHAMPTFPAGSGMSVGRVPYQENGKEMRYVSVGGREMQAMPSVQNVRISSQHEMRPVSAGSRMSVGLVPYQETTKGERHVSVASKVQTVPSVQNVGVSGQYTMRPSSVGSGMSVGMVSYEKEATAQMQPGLNTVIPHGEYQTWGDLPSVNFNAPLGNNGDPLLMGAQPNIRSTEYSSMYFNADGSVPSSQAQMHGEFYQYSSPMWNVHESDQYVPQAQVSYQPVPPNPPQEWLPSMPENEINHFGEETYATHNIDNSQFLYSPPNNHVHSQIQYAPFSQVNMAPLNAPYMEHYQ